MTNSSATCALRWDAPAALPPLFWKARASRRPKRGPRGYDAHKRVVGRKRHLLVDTQGLVLGCLVTPASVQDREGATCLLRRLWVKFPRLHWADGNYGGPVLGAWAQNCWDYTLEIVVKPPQQQGFSPLPRRWVVERTFAWLGQWRRLAKDYEQSPQSEEAFICIAMTGLMLNRMAT